MAPLIAAAAAIAGLARWVRAPGPWRPTKLRLEVETLRCAGRHALAVGGEAHRAAGLAPFEAGVEEDAVQPLGLGLALDALRAGHDPGGHVSRPCAGPCAIAAAARRSEMRLLVQEPMNTQSTLVPSIGLPGSRPWYLQRGLPGAALLLRARRRDRGSARSTAITCSGLVPQVICGATLLHVDRVLAVELGVGIGGQGAPVGDGAVPHRALGRVVAAVRGTRRSCRRAPPCRCARPSRSRGCRA